MTHFADCWPFDPCCDLMEPRAIGGPDEQGRNNILLHVHLEGKPHFASIPDRSCSYLSPSFEMETPRRVAPTVVCPAQLNHPSRSACTRLNE